MKKLSIILLLLAVLCLTGCDVDTLAEQADTAIGRNPVKEKANGIMNSIVDDFETVITDKEDIL